MKKYLDIAESSNRTIKRASQDKLLFNQQSSPFLQIYSLTPTDETKEYMERHIRKMIKKIENQEIALNAQKVLKLKKENFKSVAILFKLTNQDIILAGDLEKDKRKQTKALIGLKGILQSKVFQSNRTTVFKIPHHGSDTGYDEDTWDSILTENPFLVLTPFKHGSSLLPTQEMIQLFCTNYDNIYITSNPYDNSGKLTHSKKVKRHLTRLGLNPQKIQNHYGHIRIRISPDSSVNSIELFDRACELKEIVD